MTDSFAASEAPPPLSVSPSNIEKWAVVHCVGCLLFTRKSILSLQPKLCDPNHGKPPKSAKDAPSDLGKEKASGASPGRDRGRSDGAARINFHETDDLDIRAGNVDQLWSTFGRRLWVGALLNAVLF